jgi:hypothetical protein
MGPTWHPIQWVPVALSPGVKRLGSELPIHLHAVQRLRIYGAIPSPHPLPHDFMEWRISTRTTLYKVSQEESSTFWEVIGSVIPSKKAYVYMYPIPNGFRDKSYFTVQFRKC